MSYPKQAGQDAQAHRDLAARHLVVVQERDAMRLLLRQVATADVWIAGEALVGIYVSSETWAKIMEAAKS